MSINIFFKAKKKAKLFFSYLQKEILTDLKKKEKLVNGPTLSITISLRRKVKYTQVTQST